MLRDSSISTSSRVSQLSPSSSTQWINRSRSYPALAPSGATRSPARTAVGSPAGAGLVVVVVAVGFTVVVGRGAVVVVEPGGAVVDGPAAVVVVDSAGGPLVGDVSPPDPWAVVTVVAVASAVLSVVRPACYVAFELCEDAPATPTHRSAATPASAHHRALLAFGRSDAYSAVGTGHAAIQMRTCAHRGSLRKRSQRFTSNGTAQP